VEKSSVLNLASALLFGDDFQSPFITGSHQPPVLWECPDELLFPVIRFHYMLLRAFIVVARLKSLNTFYKMPCCLSMLFWNFSEKSLVKRLLA
jgi:hypothetical protein